uniref:CARD domain-containing protein n=1 Tax=Acanthochromis polyacanthus TaxID=80966 RepID=A0A3Q1FCL8_9TELE
MWFCSTTYLCYVSFVPLQAMDKLKSEQNRLCSWLSEDPEYILEQCGDVLSMNEFREVQKQKCDLDKMRLLLKKIIHKGEETCQSFVDILRQHQAHYPQLQQYFNPHTQGTLSLFLCTCCNPLRLWLFCCFFYAENVLWNSTCMLNGLKFKNVYLLQQKKQPVTTENTELLTFTIWSSRL